jgi:hypothetical protein
LSIGVIDRFAECAQMIARGRIVTARIDDDSDQADLRRDRECQ